MSSTQNIHAIARFLAAEFNQSRLNKDLLYEDYIEEQRAHKRTALQTYEEYSRWVVRTSALKALIRNFEKQFGVKVKVNKSRGSGDIAEAIERSKREERML